MKAGIGFVRMPSTDALGHQSIKSPDGVYPG
jgi:hypothetical protein